MSASQDPPSNRWRSPDVWNISLSAFFADLGYQAVLAIFPLYLVLQLGAPVWLYGVSQALAYGGGALFGYAGGRLAERYGRWPIAVVGNAFIPLMALAALSPVPAVAVALLVAGWWSRNLRTPPRRAMLTETVAPHDRARAFGFLHALDVGGGMLAASYALLLVFGGVSYERILLITIAPLVVSTLVLLRVRAGRGTVKPGPTPPILPLQPETKGGGRKLERRLFKGILAATVLFGFASFSIGFPVLTTARATENASLGILIFLVALGVSSVVGLFVGRVSRRRVLLLALGGYLLASGGSALFVLAAARTADLAVFLLAAGTLGAALGVVETFEPALVADVSPMDRTARNMGSLTAYRSVGLFVSNLALGFLALRNPWLPYTYAALAALVATLVLLVASGAGDPTPGPARSGRG